MIDDLIRHTQTQTKKDISHSSLSNQIFNTKIGMNMFFCFVRITDGVPGKRAVRYFLMDLDQNLVQVTPFLLFRVILDTVLTIRVLENKVLRYLL